VEIRAYIIVGRNLHGGGSFVTVEVSMTDLHETGDPKYTPQIDTVGWIFATLVILIVVIAAMVAYQGNGTVIANTPVPVGSPG
jgi:hypothetical protein